MGAPTFADRRVIATSLARCLTRRGERPWPCAAARAERLQELLHNGKTPPLVITPAMNLWHWVCACQAGGTVIGSATILSLLRKPELEGEHGARSAGRSPSGKGWRDALEIAQQTYAQYEIGRIRVPGSLLPDIAQTFGVTTDDLSPYRMPDDPDPTVAPVCGLVVYSIRWRIASSAARWPRPAQHF